jgi:hypothetical protein
MDIIDLNQRRHETAEPTYDGAVCDCGEAWFELRDGAVTMTPAGSITGYTGRPHCVGCGKPYSRPAGRQ